MTAQPRVEQEEHQWTCQTAQGKAQETSALHKQLQTTESRRGVLSGEGHTNHWVSSAKASALRKYRPVTLYGLSKLHLRIYAYLNKYMYIITIDL